MRSWTARVVDNVYPLAPAPSLDRCPGRLVDCLPQAKESQLLVCTSAHPFLIWVADLVTLCHRRRLLPLHPAAARSDNSHRWPSDRAACAGRPRYANFKIALGHFSRIA